MNLQTNNKFSWEDFFEQAAEDISMYLWAVEEWPDPPEGYDQDFLLLLALAYRSRIRSATEFMSHDMPPEYSEYSKKINHLRQEAETMLNDQVRNRRGQMEEIINNDFAQRPDNLEKSLGQVRDLALDGYLMEDPDWVADDLRNESHDFLIRFQDMALVCAELEQEPLNALTGSGVFQKRFAHVEQLFQQYFGYFHTIKDLLPGIQAREYNIAPWWLTRIPDHKDVSEHEITEDHIGSLCKTFMKGSAATPDDCPVSHMTIACALDETEPGQNRDIREHILECRYCLFLFLDVRMAEKKTGNQVLEVHPEIMSAIREGPEPKQITAPREWDFNKKLELFFQFCSSFLTPKAVSAMAVACLVLFVAVYGLYETSSPISASFMLIANTGGVSDRGDTPETGPYELKPGGVLRTGTYYKIRIRADKDGYAYVLLCGSSGRIARLFSGKISAGDTVIPGDRDYGFRLDQYPGTETVYLMTSREEIKGFGEKVRNLEKVGTDRIQSVFSGVAVQSFRFMHK